MEFKDFYTKEEMEELEKSDEIDRIKVVYEEPQATTILPVLVEKDSMIGYYKPGECILTINYNDLKAGSKMILEYRQDRNYRIYGFARKIEEQHV